MPEVKKRKLSLGEVLHNQRQAAKNRPTNARTYSEKVGNLWYRIIQIIK